MSTYVRTYVRIGTGLSRGPMSRARGFVYAFPQFLSGGGVALRIRFPDLFVCRKENLRCVFPIVFRREFLLCFHLIHPRRIGGGLSSIFGTSCDSPSTLCGAAFFCEAWAQLQKEYHIHMCFKACSGSFLFACTSFKRSPKSIPPGPGPSPRRKCFVFRGGSLAPLGLGPRAPHTPVSTADA